MEYSVESDSPTRKTITITLTAQEVDAAIQDSTNRYQKNAQVAGFRKGKAPISLIEKRFHDGIYSEATEALVDHNISDALAKTEAQPVSNVTLHKTDKQLLRNEPYTFKISFDVLPEFDLPKYTGLEVEEIVHEVTPDLVDKAIARLRKDPSRLKTLTGDALAEDGQIAVVDFETFENGEPLEDLKVNNYSFELGMEEALPEFEKLVKGIPVGHTGEGEITFPEDFLVKKLAGKTVTLKVTVKEVKEYVLQPLDDAFAKSYGHESLEKFREELVRSFIETRKMLDKSAAQRKLLDQMHKQVDFALPESMVDMEARFATIDMLNSMHERSIEALGENVQELLEEARPHAEDVVRSKILLLAIAKKENLEVSYKEVLLHVARDCVRNDMDFKSTLNQLRDSGMLEYLHDKLLADKAMDFVYDKAVVTHKDGKDEEDEEE